MHVAIAPPRESKSLVLTVSFSHRDIEGIIPHKDNPMVISLHIQEWSVNKVVIDPGYLADILY